VRQIWLCQSSVAEAEERFGRIDVVVNTASKSTSPSSKCLRTNYVSFRGSF
jgi:NAD(P)-dependent dehydrogenase (short-subunit alcohol dehydrogenase family)